jgi:iron complex transport system ATP-binding protein
MRAADRAYLLRGGQRIAEGATREVLNPTQLEALYQAPVELISDVAAGRTAFLPG